ncbi:hypothetical protein [Actinophytocola oryzae]|uniref:hypothetical protein n=1 Tax=Actinophytocola oryzae TaxID=502181 RepID=UPI001062E264|nr:hypothetical protein [Actinophytocola oryzae]
MDDEFDDLEPADRSNIDDAPDIISHEEEVPSDPEALSAQLKEEICNELRTPESVPCSSSSSDNDESTERPDGMIRDTPEDKLNQCYGMNRY